MQTKTYGGYLNAFTAYAEIYVDGIWVHAQHRCRGDRRMLLQILDNRFEEKSSNNINSVTSEFQAPEFYKNLDLILS
ncbi:hypothetical protein OQJ18_04285 [Fluoribacter dumoffii]|uniref:hypothetical protein n=1 Tax=Fluoribacter dumoffii TaxID=463 RepID=UPI0022447AC0|nr:hypothetical protein [Fluoribacter dumoffii]MCW8418696.1 hypothetical protein [Fluoribacter dumoffii]MCW8453460.1 hypothetical protein [Fluoribacter dumoffii]MCW8459320.1 hypothetical protein [Fluoribacter dumoffii]MCW8482679.1 hypothetical protein [Fluoribacter dumoffii]